MTQQIEEAVLAENNDTNVERKEGFTQVVVWPGCTLTPSQVKDFEEWIETDFGIQAQYLETIVTKADRRGPGGRHDVFFAVADGDGFSKFAVKRLAYGMRWIEDAISKENGGNTLYPQRVEAYAGWGTTSEEKPSEHECVPGTQIRKPSVRLEDGNVFAILGAVRKALRRAKVPAEIIAKYQDEATSGDYDKALQTSMQYVEVE